MNFRLFIFYYFFFSLFLYIITLLPADLFAINALFISLLIALSPFVIFQFILINPRVSRKTIIKNLNKNYNVFLAQYILKCLSDIFSAITIISVFSNTSVTIIRNIIFFNFIFFSAVFFNHTSFLINLYSFFIFSFFFPALVDITDVNIMLA